MPRWYRGGKYQPTDNDLKMADTVLDYWTSFADNGHLDGVSSPPWPRIKPARPVAVRTWRIANGIRPRRRTPTTAPWGLTRIRSRCRRFSHSLNRSTAFEPLPQKRSFTPVTAVIPVTIVKVCQSSASQVDERTSAVQVYQIAAACHEKQRDSLAL